VFDHEHRLLLIQRSRHPGAGLWSLPGGRCEAGEDPRSACVREVAEETGLQVRVVRRAGRVIRAAPQGGDYVIDDFVCTVIGGWLRAGDDAAAVVWASRSELIALPLVEGLWDALSEWGLLPV